MRFFSLVFALGALATVTVSQPTQPDDLFSPEKSALRSAANVSSPKASPNATISERANNSTKKSDPACFPAWATVAIGGAAVRMDALRVGSLVSTGANGRVSPVYLFSHKVAGGFFRYVSLRTAVGNLVASHGHYVHTARGTLAAGDVRVGDALKRANGAFAPVLSVGEMNAPGLYNPHTLDGDIVVDGFAVSTYTTHVPPQAAQSLLAPSRAMFRAAGKAPVPGCLVGPNFGRKMVLAVVSWLSRFS